MTGWKRASLLLAVCGLMAIVAAGCGSSDDDDGGGGSKGSIKVLAILDMTGPTKFLGVADKAGLDAAVTYLNKKGGIDGRKVELEVVSDDGDPTKSVTALTKYVASKGKPDFLFPGSYSTIAAALRPVSARQKILSWGFGQSFDDCGSDCGPAFGLAAPTDVDIGQAVDYFKSKGYKKIGVIDDQRDTSINETKSLKRLVPAAGLSAVYVTTPPKAVDFTPQISKLKSSGVDVVWAEQLGPAVGYVLAARKKLDWDVPVAFDISGASFDITKLAPKDQWSNDTVEQIFSDVNPKATDYPGRELMLANNPGAKQKGGFGGQPIDIAAYGWQALVMLDTVVSGTHSLDATTNQKWLETHVIDDPKVDALFTAAKFAPDHHQNQGWETHDFSIVPVAPIGNDGLIQSAGG